MKEDEILKFITILLLLTVVAGWLVSGDKDYKVVSRHKSKWYYSNQEFNLGLTFPSREGNLLRLENRI